jgi:hypothetical protein
LLNVSKNEENKGNNAIFWMFLVECYEKRRKKGNNAIFLMFFVECDEKWRK